MYDDFKELLSVLNKHKVKYLVIGAYAVGYHAQPRATKDLDVLIQPAPKNSEAVYRALVEFGAPNIGTLTPADFAEKGTFYRMGVPPVAIDILPEIKGVTFAAAWRNRTSVVIDTETGLAANFISRADLIQAKLAANRPQDIADVKALRDVAETPLPAAPKPPTRKAKPKRKPAAKP